MEKPVVIDFETEAIEPRHDYPPKPVGVAIMWPDFAPIYFSWGHPTANTCEPILAEEKLKTAWKHPGGVLFHNAKFDLAVAKAHFGLEPPKIVHDTMIVLFLADPRQPDLHLKSASERLLGMKPEERDEVADWLVEHQPVEGKRITKTNFGVSLHLTAPSSYGPAWTASPHRHTRTSKC